MRLPCSASRRPSGRRWPPTAVCARRPPRRPGRSTPGCSTRRWGLASLDPAARRRAHRWVVVSSALFGALRLTDRIPAYRLSMAVNLSPLGPLAGVWRGPLEAELTASAGSGLVVDCRSSTYAAAWRPAGSLADRWVQVAVPGATHMAKHTRGLVTRHLCESGVDARTPRRLAEVVGSAFGVELSPPAGSGRAWVLSVSGT